MRSLTSAMINVLTDINLERFIMTMKRLLILLMFMYGGCSSPRNGAVTNLPSGGTDCYYMLSDEGERFSMVVNPSKEKELLEKLRILAHLEKKAHEELKSGTTVSFLPAYSYSFIWVESSNPRKEHSFFVRGRTLGGHTVYRIDAEKYFEASSWRKAERALKGDADEVVDRLMRDIGTKDYLPEQ
jgi:hypothetical protein